MLSPKIRLQSHTPHSSHVIAKMAVLPVPNNATLTPDHCFRGTPDEADTFREDCSLASSSSALPFLASSSSSSSSSCDRGSLHGHSGIPWGRNLANALSLAREAADRLLRRRLHQVDSPKYAFDDRPCRRENDGTGNGCSGVCTEAVNIQKRAQNMRF